MTDGMKKVAELAEAFADEHIRLCKEQGVEPFQEGEGVDELGASFFDVLVESDVFAALADEIARMVIEKAKS